VIRVDTCTWVMWVYTCIMKSLNRDFTEQCKILPIKLPKLLTNAIENLKMYVCLCRNVIKSQ